VNIHIIIYIVFHAHLRVGFTKFCADITKLLVAFRFDVLRNALKRASRINTENIEENTSCNQKTAPITDGLSVQSPITSNTIGVPHNTKQNNRVQVHSLLLRSDAMHDNAVCYALTSDIHCICYRRLWSVMDH